MVDNSFSEVQQPKIRLLSILCTVFIPKKKKKNFADDFCLQEKPCSKNKIQLQSTDAHMRRRNTRCGAGLWEERGGGNQQMQHANKKKRKLNKLDESMYKCYSLFHFAFSRKQHNSTDLWIDAYQLWIYKPWPQKKQKKNAQCKGRGGRNDDRHFFPDVSVCV